MAGDDADLKAARRRYGRKMAAASHSGDPRLAEVFATVPREAFVPEGPWELWADGAYTVTPDADPVRLYRDVLVALDPAKGINNGQPSLHAAWIGAVAPQPGEAVCHIGAGLGYYTALLSRLVKPGGRVVAFETDAALADRARRNLEAYDGVTVITGDATVLEVPPSDLIYVNAGVVAPPVSWLKALWPDGRLMFPWRPAEHVGLTVLMSPHRPAFAVRPMMPSWFIPCSGASSQEGCTKIPDGRAARSARSAWLVAERPPDETAVAICRDVWFSSAELP